MTSARDKHIEMGSERGFGLVFATVFAIIGLWPLFRGQDMRLWALAVAALFLVAAFAAPFLLKWPNRLWFRLGLLLGKIVAPVVMAIIFVLTVIPTGFILRMMGKDLLKTKRQPPEVATHWHAVDPAARSSLKNQF